MSVDSSNSISLFGSDYIVLQELPKFNLTDSFVKHKIGSGNGEAKLYIGQEGSNDILRMFDYFRYPMNCFLLKRELSEYLQESCDEFYNPTQNYRDQDKLISSFLNAKKYLDSQNKEFIFFRVEKSNSIAPPRIYIKVCDECKDIFSLIRSISFSSLTSLKIIKVKNNYGSEFLYFKLCFNKNNIEKSYGTSNRNTVFYEITEEKIDSDDLDNKKSILQVEDKVNEKEETLDKLEVIKHQLIDKYHICPFSEVDQEELLIPTRIKPLELCDPEEQYDIDNFLLLSPLYSYLFSHGLISIDNDLCIDISNSISLVNRKRLKIVKGEFISHLSNITNKTVSFLDFHYKELFER